MACTVHGYHYPLPLRTVWHHIQPQGMGGLTVDTNLVEVCDTGHFNIHRCLDDLLHGVPMAAGSRSERKLAQQGYDAWVAAGKPGKPVYQLDHVHDGVKVASGD